MIARGAVWCYASNKALNGEKLPCVEPRTSLPLPFHPREGAGLLLRASESFLAQARASLPGERPAEVMPAFARSVGEGMLAEAQGLAATRAQQRGAKAQLVAALHAGAAQVRGGGGGGGVVLCGGGKEQVSRWGAASWDLRVSGAWRLECRNNHRSVIVTLTVTHPQMFEASAATVRSNLTQFNRLDFRQRAWLSISAQAHR